MSRSEKYSIENFRKKRHFIVEDTMGTRVDIRLNPAETGLSLKKGYAAHVLVKDYGLKSLFAFGDSAEDTAMKKEAELLIAVNKFIKSYMSEKNDNLVRHFISKIAQHYELNLEEEDIQKIAKAKESLTTELLTTIHELNKTPLQEDANHALVGVERPPELLSNPKVREAAIVMVKGPDGTVDLIGKIADLVSKTSGPS